MTDIYEINSKKPVSPANWKVGTSSALFEGLTEKDLETCRDAGLECVEVCLFGQCFKREKGDLEVYCRKLAGRGAELGIEFWSVHLPFGHALDISVTDAVQRKDAVKKHKELLETAACFRPQKAVIHGSAEPVPEEVRSDRLAACRESLAELAENAHRLGIQLAVECLPRTCLGNTIKEMEKLVDGIDLLGVCCDMNHLLTDRTEDFIRSFGHRVATLHVSDYDRVDERHWMPGKGVNNWNAIIDALTVTGYCGPIMFEVRSEPEGSIEPSGLKKCWSRLLEAYTGR